MLVRFRSEVGGFTTFGDVAVKLLKLMGHSGSVPGAILAADIAAALARLEGALELAPTAAEAADGDDGEPVVALRQRALPLMQLLRQAAERECSVMWEQG